MSSVAEYAMSTVRTLLIQKSYTFQIYVPHVRTFIEAAHDPETLHVTTNKEGRRERAVRQDRGDGILPAYYASKVALLR